MKRWLCLTLAMCVLFFPAALADEIEEGLEYEISEFDASEYEQDDWNFPEIEGAQTLQLGEEYSMDIDGDGSDEFVLLKMDIVNNEEVEVLQVETDEGLYTYETSILYPVGACAMDLDGDGQMEFLISGDEASADYFTWCLCVDGEKGLHTLQFADANRGENTDGYFDCGYGKLDAAANGVLTLTGSQDALGTWMCSRDFTLRDGRFELEDGGVWRMIDITADPETWEYHCLTLTRELNVTLEDGSASTLPAGEKFVVTETDKKSYVGFVTQSGVRGRIAVEPDVEEGWGFLIDGVSESEYFEYVPYAD